MKLIAIFCIFVVLVLAIWIFMPTESRVDRRAWLTMSYASLRTADEDLHKIGTVTNRFQMIRVYPYTNCFIMAQITSVSLPPSVSV
jgi:hypothetical protein